MDLEIDKPPRVGRSHQCSAHTNACNCGVGYGWTIYVLMECFDDLDMSNMHNKDKVFYLKHRAHQALIEVFGDRFHEEFLEFKKTRGRQIEIVPEHTGMI